MQLVEGRLLRITIADGSKIISVGPIQRSGVFQRHCKWPFGADNRVRNAMLANDQKVQQHNAAVERLLRVICGAEEFPWFVSDEATVFDVSTATESELLDHITASWGLVLNAEDLKLPLWQLALRLDSSSSKG